MHTANPTWGAPRIQGELPKLGFDLAQSTLSKYMPRRSRQPPSEGWRTYLRHHLATMIAIDCAIVSTFKGQLLCVFVVLSRVRRRVRDSNVTAHLPAAWTAQQMVEALPWTTTAGDVVRDRDGIYGEGLRRRVAALGLEHVVIAARTPWQNAYADRCIGPLRRDCLDHIIALDERHRLRVLRSYVAYYNQTRTHLALGKDPPEPCPVQAVDAGKDVAVPEVGRLSLRAAAGSVKSFRWDFRDGQPLTHHLCGLILVIFDPCRLMPIIRPF